MNETTDERRVRLPTCRVDLDASTHDLLSDATEWLQYAGGLTELIAELVHESDTVDCGHMALALDAIAAVTRTGLQCAAHAHARLSWERPQGG